MFSSTFFFSYFFESIFPSSFSLSPLKTKAMREGGGEHSARGVHRRLEELRREAEGRQFEVGSVVNLVSMVSPPSMDRSPEPQAQPPAAVAANEVRSEERMRVQFERIVPSSETDRNRRDETGERTREEARPETRPQPQQQQQQREENREDSTAVSVGERIERGRQFLNQLLDHPTSSRGVRQRGGED